MKADTSLNDEAKPIYAKYIVLRILHYYYYYFTPCELFKMRCLVVWVTATFLMFLGPFLIF